MRNNTSQNPLFGKFDSVAESFVQAPQATMPKPDKLKKDPTAGSQRQLTKFVDLFCGVGGFHVAAQSLGLECVFASDINADARRVYERNFGITPSGDITAIRADDIPDHDLLCAGFPCQPFSIIGKREGFADARGFLFLEVARIVAEKRPHAVMLENVKQLATADGGKIMACITSTLEALGYDVRWRVLNALEYGLPQRRERVIIVASRSDLDQFEWPATVPMPPLASLLEPSPDAKHYVSERIRRARHETHTATETPSIWHENKSGNVSSHPYSCALRAGASYNYLLVDGKRRLTPREMFRLQGFPKDFILHESDSQARKQAGNAVPVPMIQATMKELADACRYAATSGR